MEMAVAVVLYVVLIHSVLERWRGDNDWISLQVKRAVYAYCALPFVAAPEDGLWAAAFVPLFFAGLIPGWGHPMTRLLGAENERDFQRWQKGILRENLWLAVTARGAMFAPIALLTIPTGNWGYCVAAGAMTAAFPASVFLTRFIPPKGPGYLFQPLENIRGALYGLPVGIWLAYRLMI